MNEYSSVKLQCKVQCVLYKATVHTTQNCNAYYAKLQCALRLTTSEPQTHYIKSKLYYNTLHYIPFWLLTYILAHMHTYTS